MRERQSWRAHGEWRCLPYFVAFLSLTMRDAGLILSAATCHRFAFAEVQRRGGRRCGGPLTQVECIARQRIRCASTVGLATGSVGCIAQQRIRYASTVGYTCRRQCAISTQLIRPLVRTCQYSIRAPQVPWGFELTFVVLNCCWVETSGAERHSPLLALRYICSTVGSGARPYARSTHTDLR